MKKRFLSLKIKYKIMIAIYLVSIPIISVISLFLYSRTSTEVENRMSDVYQSLVNTLNKNVDYLQAGVIDLATYISINDDILYLLNENQSSALAEFPLVWEKNTPMNFVKDMISAKNHIRTMILYTENNIRPFYISRDKSVHNLDKDYIHSSEIYKRAYEAKGDYVWTRIDKGEEELFIKNTSDKIVVSRVIYNRAKNKHIGFLAMGINAEQYMELCRNARQQDNESIIIYNNQKELVRYGTVPDSILTYIQDHHINNKYQSYIKYENYYIFTSGVDDTGNAIFYIVPEENWTSQIKDTLILPFAFVGVMFMCIFPLSMLASIVISKPLRKLYAGMMKFKEGDFKQQVEVGAQDEIGVLTECFNTMVKDIKELVDTHYVMVLRQRESELNALQAQINPHFLYNTLDSLYWQAINVNNDELAEDIFALSKLFRLVLNKGKEMVPIAQEKELIFYYLQIQKMRFKKKLNYEIDIEEEIMKYTIPKLILQPFVENAVVHGLECTQKVGLITIKGILKDENIIFEIKDNGVGMTEEQLSDLFIQEDSGEYSCQRIGRFAIRNVQERLNLKYRGQYKLDIESKVGWGTTIKIIIPLQMDELKERG